MAAELAMIGPEMPVKHMPHHDLESIFYVLLGISVLYDEPYKPKPEDELSECFDVYFNTHFPSLQKTFTIQSELGSLSAICERFSDYFQPLRPLLDTFRERIVLPMTYVNGSFRQRCQAIPITHDEMVKYLVDMLFNLPDEAWVSTKEQPTNDEGGGDVFELDNFGLDLPLESHMHDPPDRDSRVENSFDPEMPSSNPTKPGLRMHRRVSIRPISGPGFTTSSSTGSGSTRRPRPGSDDADYVDPGLSRAKRLRLNIDTTNANCTNPRRSTGRLVVTAPPSMARPNL